MNNEHNQDCSAQQTLISLDEALKGLLSSIATLTDHEQLTLDAATNRVLAETLASQVDVPPADNSAVDGYAVNTEHCATDTWINVSQRIPAGSVPQPLQPGTAARIFTGAGIPEGADAVIMQENCETRHDAVRFTPAPLSGQNIRARAQDLAAHQPLLQAGQVLTPHAIALAASSGNAHLSVFKRPCIAIFSTGDELVEPGQTLQPGQIYNSNRYLLQALLHNLGCEVMDLGVIADDRAATEKALMQAASQADMIISSGGASVGEEDHVKDAVNTLGTLSMWRIAIKPGKPFMFGQIDATPFLGLPGNPGAVLVTFCVLARPALLKLMGCSQHAAQAQPRRLAFSPGKQGKRREFKRVRCNERGWLEVHPNQSSGMLSSACWADGLALIPEHSELKEGDVVEFFSFDSLLTLPYMGAR